MLKFAPSIIAIVLYLIASGYLYTCVAKLTPPKKSWLMGLSIIAIAAHFIGLMQLVLLPEGYQLGFFIALSLTACSVNIIIGVSGLRIPILNLFIFAFPFSALAVAASVLAHSPLTPQHSISVGLLIHITLSFLAYALLTVSALQAIFLSWQDRQLKQKQATGPVRLLPPLQTMEALLFNVIWAGQIALTIAILSGIVFLQDMYSQSLVHKTVLSVLAWVIYSVLLLGRHRQGWRGRNAIRWTLAGFCTLMLAYFGSKLVIELVLGGQTI